MKKRIWYDGLGNKMKPGTYNQNEVMFAKSNCVHNCGKKVFEVFFWMGGYYHKMLKCKICKGLVSHDMIDHPTGHHRFKVPQDNGFIKCLDCTISINPQPVMICKS